MRCRKLPETALHYQAIVENDDFKSNSLIRKPGSDHRANIYAQKKFIFLLKGKSW